MKQMLLILFCASLTVLLPAAENKAEDVATAINRATAFLSAQQNGDGTFGQEPEGRMPGTVALVVEALANQPDRDDEDNAAIKRSVDYLLEQQQNNGAITSPEMGFAVYDTSAAVIALTLLKDPEHQAALDKARAFLVSAQNGNRENTAFFGSFGYAPGKTGDISNTAFALEALHALKLPHDSPVWINAVRFIKHCQDNTATNDLESAVGGEDAGGFVYAPSMFPTPAMVGADRGLPDPYGSATYAAIKSLVFCGVDANDHALKSAHEWMRDNYSVTANSGLKGSEGYFHYVMMFAKAMSAEGMDEIQLRDGRRVKWAEDLATHLISIQKDDGSFQNDDGRWMESNSILTTACGVNALNLCLKQMAREGIPQLVKEQ